MWTQIFVLKLFYFVTDVESKLKSTEKERRDLENTRKALEAQNDGNIQLKLYANYLVHRSLTDIKGNYF
jgi:hypothetical protein